MSRIRTRRVTGETHPRSANRRSDNEIHLAGALGIRLPMCGSTMLAETLLPSENHEPVTRGAHAAGVERAWLRQRVPEYQVVREIGRGGMGVVFLARDVM